MGEIDAGEGPSPVGPPSRRVVSLIAMGVVLAWFVIHVVGEGWPEGAALAAAAVVADLGGATAEGNAASGAISLLVVALLAGIAIPAIDRPPAVLVGAGGLLGAALFAAGYVAADWRA